MSASKLIKRVAYSILNVYVLLAVLLSLFQDFLIFPRLSDRLFASNESRPVPPGIERFWVPTLDGNQLEVWTTHRRAENLTSPYVGLIFHGNGETVEQKNFLPFFARHGIAAFTFDYRGYGNSSGWPSETALMEDGNQIWMAVQKRTGISHEKLIILGNSIGSGLAGALAARINPHVLILVAGYTSVRDIVSSMPFYRPFLWLLRYNFPTSEYIKKLQTNCLILAHGKRDTIIDFSHFERLRELSRHKGIKKVIALEHETASHNDIYYAVERELDRELEKCAR